MSCCAKAVSSRSDPPLEVYDRPRNRFVARFIGSPTMNMIDCRLDEADAAGARVILPEGLNLVLPVDARAGTPGSGMTLGVRAEHVQANKGGKVLVGTVAAIERLGSESFIHAKLRSGDIVTCRVLDASDIATGNVVHLSIDAANCHLFNEEGDSFPPTRKAPPSGRRRGDEGRHCCT